ncbi:helix-turn-helix domain-containing protein [[Kitasatospora] papulosa]|uniref:helix-turn-helix domain-containing protein n=1 Tax=[Kitasatospora] papulosa TaxID=1464011 RepID=UPI0036B5EFCB
MIAARSAPISTSSSKEDHMSHPRYDEIRVLLEAGASDLAISRTLRVGRKTAARYRRQLGIPPHYATAASTHCRHGHPFNRDNEAFNTNGHRYCRTCVRLRQQGRKRTWVTVAPDEIAIERAVTGDPPQRLTPRERAQAVLTLRARNISAAEAAQRVGCTPRTVWRIQARHQAAA